MTVNHDDSEIIRKIQKTLMKYKIGANLTYLERFKSIARVQDPSSTVPKYDYFCALKIKSNLNQEEIKANQIKSYIEREDKMMPLLHMLAQARKEY